MCLWKGRWPVMAEAKCARGRIAGKEVKRCERDQDLGFALIERSYSNWIKDMKYLMCILKGLQS